MSGSTSKCSQTKLVFNCSGQSIVKELQNEELRTSFQIEKLKEELTEAFSVTASQSNGEEFKKPSSCFRRIICRKFRGDDADNYHLTTSKNDVNKSVNVIIDVEDDDMGTTTVNIKMADTTELSMERFEEAVDYYCRTNVMKEKQEHTLHALIGSYPPVEDC